MDYHSFSKIYKRARQGVTDARVRGKYRKLVSRFGASDNFRIRLAKRQLVMNELSTCSSVEEFLRTRCQLVPGAPQTPVIYFVQLLSNPSVQFVVKDILVAAQASSGAEDDDDEEAKVEATVIGGHVATPVGFHGQEGDIMTLLTERAIAEGFERMILAYAYDGRFLCMERALRDYKNPGPSFCDGIYEIAAFLHRHSIRHNDWLIPGFPLNNLFVMDGMKGPVIGDFGASSFFSSILSRLDDLELVIQRCRHASLERFLEARLDAGIPNEVAVSREIPRLHQALRAARTLGDASVPEMEQRIAQREELARRLKNEQLTPEQIHRAHELYDYVLRNLPTY